MENTIDEKKLLKLKKTASEILAKARHYLITRHPFVGNICMKMEVVPVRDKRLRTASTDGRSIFFDIDFLSRLKDEEINFVFAHEVWHCVMMHFLRTQNRDKLLFNIATDKEINQILKTDGFVPPANLLFPIGEEIGKSAEEIYEMLLKKQKKASQSNGKNSNENGQESSTEGSKGGFSSSGDEQNKSDKKEEGGSEKKNGNGLSGQFDKHTYADDENEKSENTITDQWGEVGYDSEYNPTIDSETAEQIRENVVESAQQVARMQGSLPEHINRIVTKHLKPEINWKDKLNEFVAQCYGDKRSFLPPNRRYVWTDSYFQSRRGEELKCCILLDTSGSVLVDVDKFMSEIVSILTTYGKYRCTIIQCDCKVQKVDEFDEYNPFPTDNIIEYQLHGFGGSSFIPAQKYIEDNALDFDVMIGFTDGYIDVLKQQPEYPVMWIVTNDGKEDFCEYGTVVKFKNK